MATTEAAAPETHAHDGHAHDHDHPSFLAHHFDTPEQQFDSGKLGMWLFLVTEVLFFSGMFCAYAVFRMLRPEVFVGSSQFLNTQLGAINTGVLLFSSLTMAWAVRCAQTEEHKKLAALLATTLSCAMVFLGVKAVEYAHKWDMGLLPAGMFTYDPAHPHKEGGPDYLLWLCVPFALALIGVIIWWVASLVRRKHFQAAVAKPLIVVCLSFFLGVGLGTFLESGSSESGDHDTAAHSSGHEETSGLVAHAPEATAEEAPEAVQFAGGQDSIRQRLAQDATNTGVQDDVLARRRQMEVAGARVVSDRNQVSGAIAEVPHDVLTPSQAGVFFSIYYCMTGIHAIHILIGVGVLIWLLVRAIRQDFNRQYFGPVDYVGLYWHLVDLIWIYLFPLLYLIR